MSVLFELDRLTEPAAQCRAAIDERLVEEYVAAMLAGAEFPPITVFRTETGDILSDGVHRVRAARALGTTELAADIRRGTVEDALWFALGANGKHGARLTETDRQHAIRLAAETWPEKTQQEIAAQVGVDRSYVSKILAAFPVIVPSHNNQELRDAEILDRLRAGESVEGICKAVHVDHRRVARIRDANAIPRLAPGSRPITKATETHGPTTETHPKAAEILASLRAGRGVKGTCTDLGVGHGVVNRIAAANGIVSPRTRDAHASRLDRMREMANEGYTSEQIGAECGIGPEQCRKLLGRAGIECPADRIGVARSIDPNRVIEHIVETAESLTSETPLIEFGRLDQSRLPDWIVRLKKARRDLDAFIRRLTHHQEDHDVDKKIQVARIESAPGPARAIGSSAGVHHATAARP